MTRSWGVRDLAKSAPAYKMLAILVSDDLRFVKKFGDLIKAEEVDQVAKAIVQITSVMGRCLSMLEVMTQGEFERNRSVSTIFRLQSLASRTMGQYVKKVGRVYLSMVIGEVINSNLDTVLSEDLEVDPNRAPGVSAETLGVRRDKLMEFAQKLFDRITSTSIVDGMPRGMRAAAHFISSECEKRPDLFTDDDRVRLIGGFIMLRFFNPALTRPESHDLLPPGQVPSPCVLRNLLLVTKLLQNLSNNVRFGNKERFMEHFNPFLLRNAVRMREYLMALPRDPLAAKSSAQQRRPWPDLDPSKLDALRLPRDLRAFDLHNFIELHRLFIKHADALEQTVNDVPPSTYRTNSDITLREVMAKLGDSPRYRDTKTARGRGPNNKGVPLDKALSMSFDVRIGKLYVEGSSTSSECPPVWSDEAFLYAGPPSAEGNVVLYFILRRFKYEWLHRFRRSLMEFLEETLLKAKKSYNQQGNHRFDLVVDLSWCRVPDEQLPKAMVDAKGFVQSLNRMWRKNVATIFVVNPGRLYFLTMHALDPVISKVVVKSKVKEIYYWKMLHNYIDAAVCRLPEGTQNFFFDCYSVDKIKEKQVGRDPEDLVTGKARILKLSFLKILDIEPDQCRIRDEIELASIDEIVTESKTITIRFDGKKVATYTLRTDEAINELLDSILQACVEVDDYVEMQAEYKTLKTNRHGQAQPRTIQTMPDCIFNMKRDVIKSVTPLIGLESAVVDGDRLILHYKGKYEEKSHGVREFKMKSGSKIEARALCKDILDGIERENCNISREKEILTTKMSNKSFVGFFFAILVAKRWLKRTRARMERNGYHVKDHKQTRDKNIEIFKSQLVAAATPSAGTATSARVLATASAVQQITPARGGASSIIATSAPPPPPASSAAASITTLPLQQHIVSAATGSTTSHTTTESTATTTARKNNVPPNLSAVLTSSTTSAQTLFTTFTSVAGDSSDDDN